ncbi:Predicted transcriptional regulator YdeE, contains AraC-type DNA-binding domain [Chitinophaga sp. CF118]|uniref:GyrI-like domain-containing protein n=1 Tax=Chitinophaga sp. CF118 TaxID=1884367 RepID=UPI0008E950EB|nr:GyrI-like domain-containing protein [Chitinophaga sp. CF118]SFD54897.1 Predicted transcriptional regulator YdeE, contains AraC-type DNA-binding domain [Chitinophaga sp. CF118]
MEKQTLKSFYVLGIAVRTTNENGQSGKDIPALWDQFMSQGIMEKIPNKIDNTVYSVYAEYEKDHTKPYTTILGCKVSNLDNIPDGMTGITIAGGDYLKRIAKGNLLQGVVFNEWTKIWNSDIPRVYTADFEVYGEKTQNPEDAEVDIFLAVK